jgi:hypothetical protein
MKAKTSAFVRNRTKWLFSQRVFLLHQFVRTLKRLRAPELPHLRPNAILDSHRSDNANCFHSQWTRLGLIF